MSLSDQQYEFAKDVNKLFIYLIDNGYKFTIGEVLRTKEQQAIYLKSGKSKTSNSKHLDKLAIDLNIFINNSLSYDAEKLKDIGNYWISLSPINVWGGSWGWDAGHFQRGK